MSLCIRSIPGIGTQFYIGDTGHSKHGSECKLFPVTGVTLPLVSMGGSSFLFTCLSIGIILSVARNVEQLEGKNDQWRMKRFEKMMKKNIGQSS